MKNLSLKSVLFTVVASTAMASGLAIAHQGGNANDSYVGAVGHHHIIDSQGDCVRTGSWVAADKTVECGAKIVKAEPAPPAPAPPADPVFETISLSAEALFDFDKSNLKPAGRKSLDGVISHINSKDDVQAIRVVGHTDSVGSDEYNQQLSLRRAASVKNYLAKGGIDTGIMTMSGMGESQPIADNKTAEGRAKNRRVDVSIGIKRQVK